MLSLLSTTDDTRYVCVCMYASSFLDECTSVFLFFSSFPSSYSLSLSLTQEGFTALCKGDSSLIDDQTSLILAFAIGENACILMILICYYIRLQLIECSANYSIYRNHESMTQASTIAQMHVQCWWWNMWWVIIYPSLPHTTLCCASMDSSSHSMCVRRYIHSLTLIRSTNLTLAQACFALLWFHCSANLSLKPCSVHQSHAQWCVLVLY